MGPMHRISPGYPRVDLRPRPFRFYDFGLHPERSLALLLIVDRVVLGAPSWALRKGRGAESLGQIDRERTVEIAIDETEPRIDLLTKHGAEIDAAGCRPLPNARPLEE